MVNEYFDLINYGGTLQYYIFELANFSVLAFFLLALYKLKVINSNSLVVWIGILFSPLLLNYFLLSPWMYGDQFIYAGEIMSLKSTGQISDLVADVSGVGMESNAVTLSVKILGLAPLPTWMTVTSLAFANKFFLLLTFLWFKRFFDNENEVLLYFLIPSLILYSSMGLRDTLIMVFSIVFIINALRGNYFIPILLLYPLFILKLQMAAFLLLYLIGRLIFRAHRGPKLFLFFVFSITTFGVIFESQLLDVINLYRLAFIQEDFVFAGESSYTAWNLYGGDGDAFMLSSIAEAAIIALLHIPELLLIPLPWNWSNIFYPLQSLESCFLIYLYIKLAGTQQLYKNYEFILLTLALFVGLAIYALIMSNEGTFVRYRFTLFYPFLLGIYYLAYRSDDSPQKS